MVTFLSCRFNWPRFSFLFSLVTVLPSFGQTIRGTVFRDFNSNGIYESISNPTSYTYGEPGVGGVSVTAYNADGAVVASTSSSTLAADLGTYTLTVGNTNAYRIEFSALIVGDYETFRGSSNATSVQFVNGGATNVNFGVNYPADYCQSTAPPLITTCFIAGNASTGSASITRQVAMVGMPYTVEDDTKTVTYYATIGEIGSAWGIAYKKDARQLFSAAFTKRHTGFSAGGPNAIYITTPTSASSGNTSLFFSFTSVGGSAVTSTTEAHGNDLPTSTASLASHDNAAFDAVGKTSLGGMDISDDSRALYVVNLKDRKLYTIDVATKTATGVVIPNPGCTTTSTAANGSYRPFAIKYYRGKIYVGVVCTREDLGNSIAAYGPTNGLSATVYAIDATTPASFTTVLSFPLTYQKAPTNADKTPVSTTNPARAEFWRPWTSIYQADRNEGIVSYPQAWLTDIEFEPGTGDMLIGLRDRFGDQIGYKNYKPFTTDTDLISAISPGEILRAHKCNPTDTQWTLENNGALCGVVTSASATQSTVAGPGTGKYYWGDRVQNGGNHGMSSQAGIAQLGGSNRVAMTAVDPTEVFNTGGIKRLINATGAKDGNPTGTSPNPSAGAILYADDVLGYGKANGLGDLELVCNPAPIQIGNRVWLDRNNNGIQDPGEPPLSGVRVTLSGTGLSTPISVTTNANGEYYFSNASGSATSGFVYSLTGLTSGGSYSLSFPTSYSTLTLSTKPNSATGTHADLIDSDPNSAGQITFQLGQSGQNDFSFDAGYSSCALAITANAGACNPATNTYAVTGTVSFTNIPNGLLTITDGAVSTTLSIVAGTPTATYSFSGLTSGTGSHTVTASYSSSTCAPVSATYAAPVSCSATPVCVISAQVTPGACATATNTHSITAVVTLKNPTVGVLTVTNGTQSLTFATTDVSSATYTAVFAGLSSDGNSHTLTANLTGCGSVSTAYTAPASCSAVTPTLELEKRVNKSVAQLGDILTYTIVVTNIGANATSNVIVRDSLTTGLTYVSNSATVPTGTTFTSGNPISTWTIPSIGAGQSLSLIIQAVANQAGILHNTAFIPGDTVSVCTSIPMKVCVDDDFEFLLTAPLGRSHYQWYKDGQPVQGATSNQFSVTAVGAYSLNVDSQNGQCPKFSCCPFLLEADSLPRFQASAIPTTCVANTSQANGQLVLSGFRTGYTYQYVLGNTFTTSGSGDAKPIPANGIIVDNLANPVSAQAYTVRVYNQTGCYTDVTVLLAPTSCGCPASRCIPYTIQQTKRTRRIGDPIH